LKVWQLEEMMISDRRFQARWTVLGLMAIVLIALPANWTPAYAQARIREFRVPGPGAPFLNTAHDITVGPDGNIWFTIIKTNASLVPVGGAIGRFSLSGPRANKFDIFVVDPAAWPGVKAGAVPGTITAGPDGDQNLWFTLGGVNQIGRISVGSGNARTVFNVFSPNSNPLSITAGPDNRIWFTENGRRAIGRMALNGTMTAADEFPMPVDVIPPPPADPTDIFTYIPFDITLGPDGNLWFTATRVKTLGTAEPNKTTIGRISVAGAFFVNILDLQATPGHITAGSDGNLWFTLPTLNQIGRLSPGGGDLQLFTLPTPSRGPRRMTSAPDGNIWFTEPEGNRIGRIATDGTITEFLIPTLNSAPFGITATPDRAIWFAELFNIARLDMSTAIPGFLKARPPLVDFKTVTKRRTYSAELRLSNDGPTAVTINNFELDNPEFRLATAPKPGATGPTLPITIQPGKVLLIYAQFSPLGNRHGDRFAVLTVHSDARNDPVVVRLKGHFDPP
jgi:streptogramin lyase